MESFGRYTLIRRIGIGGMAEIWKAKAAGPGGFEKILAIKKVLPELADDGPFIEMFIEEAKLVAGLVHPNIVQVFDFGAVDNDYFIAMEYVPGTNLAQVLKKLVQDKVRMAPTVAIYIAVEMLKGLGYAHNKTDPAGKPLGIVHRDATPHNVLISFSGDVKVTDFGIAKVTSAKTRTTEGQVRGKLAYMSPEQVASQPLDARCDVFAVGVTLFELASGTRLFMAPSDHEVYARVAGFKGLSPQQLSLVPEALRPIVIKALEPDREKRYADAKRMEAALSALDGGMQAREILGSIMVQLFEKQLAMEREPTGPVAIPANTLITEAPGDTKISDLSKVSVLSARPRSRKGMVIAATAATAVLLAVALVFGRPLLRLSSTPATTPGATPSGLAMADPVPSPTASAASTTLTPATATATATALAVATPIRTRVPRPSTPTPRPTLAQASHTPVVVASAKGKPGFLFVAAQPWVEVWVDGDRVARETPLRDFRIASGKHAFRFVNPPSRAQVEKTLEVPADGNLRLFVDITARSVEVE